jgi:hypothetical protein
MILWGPTIVAQLMSIPVKQAAHFFVYVTAAGIIGKFLFSFAGPLFGRRRLGQIHGFGVFVALTFAAYFHSKLLGGVSIFVVALAVTDFFNSGGFSNLAPYTPEAYGVRMGSRASGLGERRRQDPRPVEPGDHRRYRQHSEAGGDRGGGVPGFHVSRLLRSRDRVRLHLPRARDARPAGGAGRRCDPGSGSHRDGAGSKRRLTRRGGRGVTRRDGT